MTVEGIYQTSYDKEYNIDTILEPPTCVQVLAGFSDDQAIEVLRIAPGTRQEQLIQLPHSIGACGCPGILFRTCSILPSATCQQ